MCVCVRKREREREGERGREGDVGDLLAVADQMSECLLNITGEEAKELADAQTDSVVRGKLRLRTLVAAGSNMASQIGFMRRNATYCWSNEHYPVGVPNILIWAHAKGVKHEMNASFCSPVFFD